LFLYFSLSLSLSLSWFIQADRNDRENCNTNAEITRVAGADSRNSRSELTSRRDLAHYSRERFRARFPRDISSNVSGKTLDEEKVGPASLAA